MIPPIWLSLYGPAILAGVLLLVITALVLWFGRRRRYLIVGWFWYVGALLPVIGIIQVGIQARADRYTYIPSIGIYWLVVWGACELASRWERHYVATTTQAAAEWGAGEPASGWNWGVWVLRGQPWSCCCAALFSPGGRYRIGPTAKRCFGNRFGRFPTAISPTTIWARNWMRGAWPRTRKPGRPQLSVN